MAGKRKLRFFVVDDDPEVVDIIRTLIESEGHAATVFLGSEEVLSKSADENPDVILIDLMMPGTDGLELCKKLSELQELRGTKLIIVSGKAYEPDRRRAFEFGAHGYITKPVRPETFMTKINRILEDRIDIGFWGVRGTLPVPGESALKYGGNTSCVSVEFAKGNFLIFDAGTGIKTLSDWLVAERRQRLDAKIFISHPHWDHINALPFFVPLYIPGNEFEILGASHGNLSMREMISAQMDGVYFPIRIKQFGARVYFRDLEEEEFSLGDGITIKTKLLNHPGKCLGYRVEYDGRSICYLTDQELDLETSEFYNPFYVKNLIRFVQGTDVLIADTTYSDQEYQSHIGWGHSAISQVTDIAHSAGVKTLYLFHHDPDQSDTDIDAKLEAAQRYLEERKSKTQCVAPKEGDRVRI